MKTKIGKELKVTGISLLSILLALAFFLTGLCIYHKLMLRKEKSVIENTEGLMVEVDGNYMNLYMEGDGEKTLVFLAGAGTPSPMYDFKPLYTRLSDKYKIVVIERFGYGYSDECEGDRPLDLITDQDRQALAEAGVDGPYILVPHSLSGAEAIWWANHYPDEIEAIIGLDMNIPAQYDAYPVSLDDLEAQDLEEAISSQDFYDFWMYDIGLVRLFNAEALLPALTSDDLTEEEKEQYRALTYVMYCRGSGATWARESVMTEHALTAMQEYVNGPIPDVPTLMIVSDGTVMKPVYGDDCTEIWRSIHEDYVSRVTVGDIIELDCGHYVHAEMPDQVAAGIEEFLDSLEQG
ncbi:MAG: alpha/beta hydrolase [Clostridiales bacterium]|nr:alpha/beta hydrolase [Clostridiales bacterium]